MTSLFYDPATARIYYTLSGSSSLFYRYFQTQSTITGASRFTATGSITGLKFTDARSMFLDGARLYVADIAGTLTRWDWNAATGQPVAGTNVRVSGPAVDGINWTARDAFIFAGSGTPPPPVNQAPVARFVPTASGLVVNVDGTGSTDSDGTVASYGWDFGDGGSAAGATASHTYAAAGQYTITLTVTDNAGATGAASTAVTVTAPGPPGQTVVTFRTASQANVSSSQPALIAPADIRAGDGLLLFVTVNTTTPTVSPPTGISGWQLLGSRSGASLQTYLWAKIAESSDPGATLTVPLSAIAKSAVQLVGYAGITGTTWVDAAVSIIENTSTSVRTTPAVPVSDANSTLVSYWANNPTWITAGRRTPS